MPEILSLLLSSLGTRMLSDVGQAALEFRTEIGRFGRDLDGHASGFTPIEPPKRKQVYCDFEPEFLGAGYAGKKVSLPGDSQSSNPVLGFPSGGRGLPPAE